MPELEGSDHAPAWAELEFPEEELTCGSAAAGTGPPLPPLPLSSRTFFDSTRQATLPSVLFRRPPAQVVAPPAQGQDSVVGAAAGFSPPESFQPSDCRAPGAAVAVASATVGQWGDTVVVSAEGRHAQASVTVGGQPYVCSMGCSTSVLSKAAGGGGGGDSGGGSGGGGRMGASRGAGGRGVACRASAASASQMKLTAFLRPAKPPPSTVAAPAAVEERLPTAAEAIIWVQDSGGEVALSNPDSRAGNYSQNESPGLCMDLWPQQQQQQREQREKQNEDQEWFREVPALERSRDVQGDVNVQQQQHQHQQLSVRSLPSESMGGASVPAVTVAAVEMAVATATAVDFGSGAETPDVVEGLGPWRQREMQLPQDTSSEVPCAVTGSDTTTATTTATAAAAVGVSPRDGAVAAWRHIQGQLKPPRWER